MFELLWFIVGFILILILRYCNTDSGDVLLNIISHPKQETVIPWNGRVDI